jgi:catechol 2,3-dioxygenase-like lactoylglutathione lyase family enzyme
MGVDPDFQPARKAHPALLVDDLAALMDRLERAGHPTIGDAPIAGYARCFTEDPFGNRIEIMQITAGSTI